MVGLQTDSRLCLLPPTRDKTGCNIDSVSILSTQVMLLIPVTSLETFMEVHHCACFRCSLQVHIIDL